MRISLTGLAPVSGSDPLTLRQSALAKRRAGKFAEASALWRSLLEIDADDAAAARELGLDLLAAGETKESAESLARSLRYDGEFTATKLALGEALLRLGRPDEAKPLFEAAERRHPGSGEAALGLAKALNGLGSHELAVLAASRACKAMPDSADAIYEHGAALRGLKKTEPAIAAMNAALDIDPAHLQAGYALSALLGEEKRAFEGIGRLACLAKAHPENAGVWLMLGAAHQNAGEFAAALEAFDRSLAIEPTSAGSLVNKGLALFGLNRTEEGIGCCKLALEIEPDSVAAQFNMGCMNLSLGRMLDGFEGYEFRFSMNKEADFRRSGRKEVKAPVWKGEDLRGKSILVLGEQANGDYIHFARYARALTGLGATVAFFVPGRLKALLTTLGPDIEIISEIDFSRQYDFQVYLMSLGLHFERIGLPIPAQPYLKAEPERVARWAERIGDQGLRVAVAWHGARYGGRESERAFPLAALQPVANLPGVRLISLQKGEGSEQIETAGFPVETLGDDFDSGPDGFVDTLAVMACVDLVICCDTSIAHLAGALGRPVWIALNEAPEWRWMRGVAESYWYPTARLFRKGSQGGWAPVLAQMAIALNAGELARGASAGPVLQGRGAPKVPVAWGECIDKITILEIKERNITAAPALANVRRELEALSEIARPVLSRADVAALTDNLREVNQALWTVEDDLRDCEADGRFDATFIELARSVYKLNDKRARFKRHINDATASSIVEEKSYRDY